MPCVFFNFTQDGRQKWRENDFGEKSLVHRENTPWEKKLIEIVLSHTVSEINAFLRFTKKFKMAAKNGGKTIFGEKSLDDSAVPWGSKISKPLCCTVSKINAFYAEIRDGHHKWQKNNFGGKSPHYCVGYPSGQKFRRTHSLAPFLR